MSAEWKENKGFKILLFAFFLNNVQIGYYLCNLLVKKTLRSILPVSIFLFVTIFLFLILRLEIEYLEMKEVLTKEEKRLIRGFLIDVANYTFFSALAGFFIYAYELRVKLVLLVAVLTFVLLSIVFFYILKDKIFYLRRNEGNA